MGDQRRVLLAQKRAIGGQEIEQVRHLLQVGWHVRVVAAEVHVVELEIDDVLDRPGGRTEATSRRRWLGGCWRRPARQAERDREQDGTAEQLVHTGEARYASVSQSRTSSSTSCGPRKST